jgi:hypothetical protein
VNAIIQVLAVPKPVNVKAVRIKNIPNKNKNPPKMKHLFRYY